MLVLWRVAEELGDLADWAAGYWADGSAGCVCGGGDGTSLRGGGGLGVAGGKARQRGGDGVVEKRERWSGGWVGGLSRCRVGSLEENGKEKKERRRRKGFR